MSTVRIKVFVHQRSRGKEVAPQEAPNLSIERTIFSGLRPLPTAAHVKR